MPTTWVITGSNRGIGFGILSYLSLSSEHIIFATCRDPSSASDLLTLASSLKTKAKIHIVQLDVKEPASIGNSVQTISSIIGDLRLDCLINNAGGSVLAQTALNITPAAFDEDMKLNVLAPALVSQAFLPLLERPAAKSQLPVVMNMSSRLGSIALDHGPREAVYSICKAAVNMLTYKQSAEKRNIIWIAMHPGWVKTELGGSDASLSVAETVPGIVDVVLTATAEDSGSFKDYTGRMMPW